MQYKMAEGPNEFLTIDKGNTQPITNSFNLIADSIGLEQIEFESSLIVVSDERSARLALEMALQSRKIKNQAECSRKQIIGPNMDFTKAVNTLAKDLAYKLQQIEDRLIDKISEWREKEKENPFFNLDKIIVEDGSLQTKDVWEYEVYSETALPREYLMIDEKAIEADIKNGIRQINGVKIFKREEISIRVKN
jgi:hypothetical protein